MPARKWVLMLLAGLIVVTIAAAEQAPPRITEKASTAAQQHYEKPTNQLSDALYQIFLAGVNREWIIQAHDLHRKEITLNPSATRCEANAKALEASARAHPFALHFALMQKRCAEALNQPFELFEQRIEANFYRMLQGQRGTSTLEPTPAFSLYEVWALADVIGAEVEMQEIILSRYDMLVVRTLLTRKSAIRKNPTSDDLPTEKVTGTVVYIDLLGEDLGARLDRHRFVAPSSKTTLIVETISSVHGSIVNAEFNSKILQGVAFKDVLTWVRTKYAEQPMLARYALAICAEDLTLKCSAQDVEPLLNLAEQENPVALVTLASDRLLGLTSNAEREAGMLLLETAEINLGSSTLDFILPEVTKAPEFYDYILRHAFRGNAAAQVFAASVLSRKDAPENLRDRWLARPSNSILSPAISAFATITDGVIRKKLVSADSYCQATEASLAFPIRLCLENGEASVMSDEWRQRFLEISAANFNAGEKVRTAAHRALTSFLYQQGQLQAAINSAMSEVYYGQKIPPELPLLALKGVPISEAYSDFLERITDPKTRAITSLQFEAGKSKNPFELLSQRCEKGEVNACHGVIPMLAQTTATQSELLLDKAIKDDQAGKYSTAAVDRIAKGLRQVEQSELLLALQAIEALSEPSDAILLAYTRHRCMSSNSEIFSPAKALPRLAAMRQPNAPWWLHYAASICTAGNRLFTFAIKGLDGLPPPESVKNVPWKIAATTLISTARHLIEAEQLPIFDVAEQVLLPIQLKLVDAPKVKLQGLIKSTLPAKMQAGLAAEFAQLVRITEASNAAIQHGLRVTRRMGFVPNVRDFGTDELQYAPFFLREIRATGAYLVTDKRLCSLKYPAQANASVDFARFTAGKTPSAEDGWSCNASSGVGDELLLPLDLSTQTLLAAKLRDADCEGVRCQRLTLAFAHTDWVVAGESTALAAEPLSLLAAQLTLEFDPQSQLLLAAIAVLPEGRWEYRYSYDQEIAHARLPEKCGVAVPANLPKGQNKITALKTSDVRNPNASIGNKEETIIIDKKELEEADMTVAEFLQQISQGKNAESELCRY